MPLAPSASDSHIEDEYDIVELPNTPANADSASPASAVSTTTAAAASQPNKKFLDEAPKIAQGSVMKETIAMAETITSNVTHLAEDVTSAAAAVTAHEIHGRIVEKQLNDEKKVNNSTTSTTATTATTTTATATSTEDATLLNRRKEQLAARHTQVVSKSAEAGKMVGSIFGAQAGKVIHFLARRIGAHQCDNCNKQNLYDYYICQKCENFDLCQSCHASFRSNPSSVNHTASHTFEFHQNGIFAIKILGAVVLALVLVRAIFGIV